MQPGAEDFARTYAAMSESELLHLAGAYDSLIEAAQDVLRAEFARRHLEPPVIEETDLAGSRTLVTVRRYRDLSEAIVARSVLEASGIASFLQNENLIRLDWPVSNAIGGIRLQVDASDEAAAIELLNQPIPDPIAFGGANAPEDGDAEDGADFAQPHCPRCGSVDIAFQGSSRAAAITALWAVGLPFPPGPKTWLCNTCNARWEDTDDSA
jgi:hypothetical protein